MNRFQLNVRCTAAQKSSAIINSNVCGLSLSAYVSSVLFDKPIEAELPTYYHKLFRELFSIRNNFNQIERLSIRRELPLAGKAQTANNNFSKRILFLKYRAGR